MFEFKLFSSFLKYLYTFPRLYFLGRLKTKPLARFHSEPLPLNNLDILPSGGHSRLILRAVLHTILQELNSVHLKNTVYPHSFLRFFFIYLLLTRYSFVSLKRNYLPIEDHSNLYSCSNIAPMNN